MGGPMPMPIGPIMLSEAQMKGARMLTPGSSEAPLYGDESENLIIKILNHIHEQLECHAGIDLDDMVDWADEMIFRRCEIRAEEYADTCKDDTESYYWELTHGILKGICAKKLKKRLYSL